MTKSKKNNQNLNRKAAHKNHNDKYMGLLLTHHADVLRRRVEHHRRKMHGGAPAMLEFYPKFRFRLNFSPRWVGFQEELTGRLPERLDLLLHCLSHHWITLLVEIHSPLICEIVEHIGRSNSFWTFLLVAKDQVDPLVKLARHKLRL